MPIETRIIDQIKADVLCPTLLEILPPVWCCDRRESTRRSLKYRRADGEVLLVTHQGRGWWDPHSSAKGDVFRLAQFLRPGLTFRAALSLVQSVSVGRPAGIANPGRLAAAPARFRVDGPHGSQIATGSAAWRYLTLIRKLPVWLIQAADQAGLLREGPCGSAWFAHTDQAGVLSGFEMRGPQFRGFSAGARKTLFRFARHITPNRMVVAEAAIDALSLAALERAQTQSLYLSTAGGIGPGTEDALRHVLAALPKTGMLAIATDADQAGERLAERLHGLAMQAGKASTRLPPPSGAKDWNEVLQKKK